MGNGEKLDHDGDKNSWEFLTEEQEGATGEQTKAQKIAEIDEAIRKVIAGEANVELPDNSINNPEYLKEMREKAEEAAELLPADEKEKFVDYIQSLNGDVFILHRPENCRPVAEGINRVLGGEDIEDYRRDIFDKAREADGDEDIAYFRAQNVYESVVGYFGPAERALNQRNRLLDTFSLLEDQSRVLSEAYNSGVASKAVREAEREYEKALRDDLVMATTVAAIMLVPEEQKQGLKEFAAESAPTDEFERIAEGIFRHHKGDSLEKIKTDLFPIVSADYAKASNAKNQAEYEKLVGFLGLGEKAEDKAPAVPGWIQAFLRRWL